MMFRFSHIMCSSFCRSVVYEINGFLIVFKRPVKHKQSDTDGLVKCSNSALCNSLSLYDTLNHDTPNCMWLTLHHSSITSYSSNLNPVPSHIIQILCVIFVVKINLSKGEQEYFTQCLCRHRLQADLRNI